MFFSHFVLAKKGPLARIWLAAHWDKKLTKAHIMEINIERSVEGILQPKIKLALRTSGHLLLGVVRIYSRKAKYLLAECNEAFVKIKMAFRPGMVDLPEGNREAALAAITLPEVFHDFENISDITIEVNTPTTLHQSRAEDITLKEDYGAISLMGEDAFGDMGFDDPEMARDATNIDEGFDHTGLLGSCNENQETTDENVQNGDVRIDDEATIVDDTLGLPSKNIEDAIGETTVCLFESGLFTDAPVAPIPLDPNPNVDIPEPPPQQQDQPNIDLSDEDTYCDPPSIGMPSPPSSPESVAAPDGETDAMQVDTVDAMPTAVAATIPPPPPPPPLPAVVPPQPEAEPEQYPVDQTTLIPNENEAFTLAPLDTTVHRGVERTRHKRKRKLIVDEIKNISGEEMKAQLSDTRDIISTLDLAPPTKRLMHWKESGGVEKLFALPGNFLHSKTLSRLYLRHLTTRSIEEEPFETDDHYPTLADVTAQEIPKESDNPAGFNAGQVELENDVPVSSAAFPSFDESIVPNENEQFTSTPETRSVKRARLSAEAVGEVQPLVEPAAADTSLPVQPCESDSTVLAPDVLSSNVNEIAKTSSGQEEISNFVQQTCEQVPDALQDQQLAAKIVQDSSAVPVSDAEKSQETSEKSGDVSTGKTSTSMEALFDELTNRHMPTQSEESAQENSEPPKESSEPVQRSEEEGQEKGQPVQQNGDLTAQEKQDLNMLLLDDDDDYHNPGSVGPPEEQLCDETYEQFEERIHSKRGMHMLRVMKSNLDAGNRIPFSALTKGSKRKQVAQKFYTCLVLKKQNAIEMEQRAAYEEVYITRGVQLDALLK